ncbi:nicotinamide riboside kinase 1 isoform X1 [Vulpes lagopus]|uniref:nicotinamide riboside kinase 1 isoform X1 n=1 Tax=Vulpes lagopus TaxID=494514 RepID=UPI001BC9280B|nr:nicotinamide riboside kinase 1 isoform X1 [Vulpes lagopus]XP_041601335.1 nicotinamide riboside kinase 1 isoform X1 [Vulpes lagopus]XP_041601336.1 nicotinamide riboside kinase 1 isoform X1 [Vulpes lagopus]
MKTFVIGISGVTNGGKTTLAKNLQKHLPNCSVISQDDFFKPESEIAKDTNGFLQYDVSPGANSKLIQWAHLPSDRGGLDSCFLLSTAHKVLEALNMDEMMSTISCWMENPSTDSGSTEEIPILIIEGFLLFNYKPLDTLWNRSYFLTIPYEECKRRRSKRVYKPPDASGYFDGHVWPMYLKHRQEMENITRDIVYLDGTKSEEELFTQVYEDLIQELAKQKCLQVTT